MRVKGLDIRFKTLNATEILELSDFKYIAVTVSGGTCTLENNIVPTPEQLVLVDGDNWATSTDGGLDFNYLKLTAGAGATVRIEYHS